MRVALLLVSALLCIMIGCVARTIPGSAGSIAAAESSQSGQNALMHSPIGESPTPEEIIACMRRSLESKPVLHVIVHNRHHGVLYECQGWHSGPKVLNEVRKDGKLIFASYSDGQRVQEYVPTYTFANKIEASGVLIEHDVTEGGWFCFPENDFTCGPGSIATGPFIATLEMPPALGAFLANMQPPTLVEDAVMNNRSCYRYHFKDEYEPGSSVTWELFIDKVNFEPVRMSGLMVIKGKISKDDVYDYTFKHLPDDRGIRWGLDVERLRKE